MRFGSTTGHCIPAARPPGPLHALMCPGGKAPQGAYVDSTESGTGTRTSERPQPHRADRPHRPLGRPAPPSPLQDEAPPHGTNRPRMMKPFIPQAITASASSRSILRSINILTCIIHGEYRMMNAEACPDPEMAERPTTLPDHQQKTHRE